jgi:H+-transporting ATPase
METTLTGLSTIEAAARLRSGGANVMPDTRDAPWKRAADQFWSPVPWMLEGAVVLELALGKYVEASVIGFLLIFNAVVGLVQEGRAQQTLAALKSRLAMTASVLRDRAWVTVPAEQVVPGDVIKLSLGGVVAADARLLCGDVQLDQSMLTGESLPVDATTGSTAYAGALVRRGEAEAEVTATGIRTSFGHTAELVLGAHVESSQQKAVTAVVRNLVCFAFCVIIAMAGYAVLLHLPPAAIIPLVLTAILGSIPVALPATFTVAAAIGARKLAKEGVLSTRLSAVDEAGTMDVLCVDKTGTLTQNALVVAKSVPMHGIDAAHLLRLAALASSTGGQDPVDAAIRAAAAGGGTVPHGASFVPFDLVTKMSAANMKDDAGAPVRVVKGAFSVVRALAAPDAATVTAADDLEQQGFRVLAVAAGPPAGMRLAGLIGLSDPPRPDSAALVAELRGLGITTVMVTGDARRTAAFVAHAIGMTGKVCPSGPIPPGLRPDSFAVFAGVLPDQKYNLVKSLQTGGFSVGMCGDGANDAPALRQAQFGIAVSTATDVAKSAAGMVLTDPGVPGIVAAVRVGRRTFQRIQTYTINSITKKIVTVFFLMAGLVMTGHAILTPLLMVIIMIAGDFLSMSLTTDNVRASPVPNAWHIGRITVAAVVLAITLLIYCSGMVAAGFYLLHLPLAQLQTLSFVTLVFGSQVMIYTVRSHPHIWSIRPSAWVAACTCADVAAASAMAVFGIAMAKLPYILVAETLAAACVFLLVLDVVQWVTFRQLGINAQAK